MIDVWNRVMTNLQTALKDICPNITSASNNSPTRFPVLMVDQTDDRSTAEDLENTENAVLSVMELQAYSNKNLTEARSVISAGSDAMRRMGYQRRMGPQQIQNVASPNVFRVVARFERFVGDGEEIEKFDTE